MEPDKTDKSKEAGDEKDEEKEKEDEEDDEALTARDRYDRRHPTISVRVSERARKKLERYKEEGMTWAEVVEKGLKYAEEAADRHHVIQVIQEIVVDTFTEEMGKVLQKNRTHMEELKQKLEQDITRKIQEDPFRSNLWQFRRQLGKVEGRVTDIRLFLQYYFDTDPFLSDDDL